MINKWHKMLSCSDRKTLTMPGEIGFSKSIKSTRNHKFVVWNILFIFVFPKQANANLWNHIVWFITCLDINYIWQECHKIRKKALSKNAQWYVLLQKLVWYGL